MKTIMKLVLLLLFTLHRASADTHSLEFLLTGVTPGISCPEFSAVGQVDGFQLGYYDSNSRKLILRAEWLKDIEDKVQQIILEDTFNFERGFKASIATVMQLFNQTGIHTLQGLFGCELHDDGTKTGFVQFGYDGEDAISLDLKTLSWTTANDKVVFIKEEWERTVEAIGWKNFLEVTCPEWLQKNVEYGRETLKRKVPPEVSLFQKNSSSPVVCRATGFYPKSVMIYWQKNGEDLDEDVEIRETLPNMDGTFQKRSILTVSPEELNKHDYTCIIQHSSLEQEIVLHVINNRAGVSTGIIVGVVVAVLLLITSSIGGFVWMRKKKRSASQSI